MERPALDALFLHFLVLAFLAIGGAPTILPGLHRYVVETHQWLTSPQFADAYALAQVAPGPNAMYIPLIGWLVAGWAGAAVAFLALLGPASTLTCFVGRLTVRYAHVPLGHAIRRGLTPITIGLMLASGWVLARGQSCGVRVSAHAGHGRAGPAHARAPAVADRRGRARRGGWARLTLQQPL
jgi:chromate transporter